MRAERRARRRRRRRRRQEGRRTETDRLMRESSALSLSLLSPLSSLSAPLKPLSSASRPLPELLSCPRPQHLPLPQLPQLPQLPSCPRALFLGFVPSASSLAPDRHASLACFSPLDVLPGVLVLPALAGAAGGDGGAPGRIRGAACALPACPRQPYVARPDENAGPARARMCACGPHGCVCHPTPAPAPARAPRPRPCPCPSPRPPLSRLPPSSVAPRVRLPCAHCDDEIYCSDTCRQNAWHDHHARLCVGRGEAAQSHPLRLLLDAWK